MSSLTNAQNNMQKSEQDVHATDGVRLSQERSVQWWLLVVLVFVAGAVSLAVEMGASRLLEPYFGDSMFVWASIIGLILLYLTMGYYVGGLLSDRHPRATVLYVLTIVAALFVGIIPLIAQPVLSWAQLTFATTGNGVLTASLLSVLVLFAIPTILIGCVSPFAIRLCVVQVGSAGRISGLLYAISTAGSIVGTFLPVLVLLPGIGTRATFYSAGALLLLTSLVGLLLSRSHYFRTRIGV
jgi:predicted membrane-bound spermidine synthase